MRIKLGVTIALLAFAGIGLASSLAGGNTGRPENLRSLINAGTSNESNGAIRAVLASQQAAWNRGDILAFLESGYWNSPELTWRIGVFRPGDPAIRFRSRPCSRSLAPQAAER